MSDSETIEQLIHTLINENLDLGCAIIEAVATHQSTISGPSAAGPSATSSKVTHVIVGEEATTTIGSFTSSRVRAPCADGTVMMLVN
uniref:Uncharacterized protein n=1 Tax=Zea mays TaxID=4577 RepID=A0A804R4Q8_MAIZE